MVQGEFMLHWCIDGHVWACGGTAGGAAMAVVNHELSSQEVIIHRALLC